ncbi:MAG: MarC family protein, partial [Thermodesulfatator sp.]
TALSLVGRKTDPLKIFTVIGVFGLVCLLTYLCFIYGESLTKRFRPYWVGVMTRLMGLILAVMAVQMILEGLGEVLPQMLAR